MTGHPPHFETTADHSGNFQLSTIPEPHQISVAALGYRPQAIVVGSHWFFWNPKGKEQLDVRLKPESEN